MRYIEPITTGRESKVFRLNIAGRSFVIKKHMLEGRQNYLVENYIYKTLAALGVHVPHVVFASRRTLIMDTYAGEELDDEIELFNRKEIFAAAARDLTLCRGVPVIGFGELAFKGGALCGTSTTWTKYLEMVESVFESSLLADAGLSATASKKLAGYWFAQKPSMNLTESFLVHGDFAMSAIFVQQKSYEGLIDFGDALAGDPLADLAYWRYKEITKSYGYKLYRQFLEPYCAATGISDGPETERRICFYMIYWGLKRLKDCPDHTLRKKFADKLNEVAKVIDSARPS